MIGYDVRFCDYCRCSIVAGQRWVREKIYDPGPPTEMRLTATTTPKCSVERK